MGKCGACIKDFKIIDEIPDGYYLVGIGLDFGNNDPNAAVALYKDDRETFIFDEILYKPKISIDQIYGSIKTYDAITYADYAWPQSINELRKRGANIQKCRKGPDSIKYGIDLLNERDISVTLSLIHI